MIYKINIHYFIVAFAMMFSYTGKCNEMELVENFVYKPRFSICHVFIDSIKKIGFDAFEYDDTEIMNQVNEMSYSEMYARACIIYKEYTDLRRKWLTGNADYHDLNEWRNRNLLSIECWIRMGAFFMPCQAARRMETFPQNRNINSLVLSDYHFLYFEWILINAERVNGRERDCFSAKEQSYIIIPPYFCPIKDVVIYDKCIHIYEDAFNSFTYPRLSDHNILFIMALNFSCSLNMAQKKCGLCGIRWKDGKKIEIQQHYN